METGRDTKAQGRTYSEDWEAKKALKRGGKRLRKAAGRFPAEVLDTLLKDCRTPEDFVGEQGLLKRNPLTESVRALSGS